jgi:hypothetical protein
MKNKNTLQHEFLTALASFKDATGLDRIAWSEATTSLKATAFLEVAENDPEVEHGLRVAREWLMGVRNRPTEAVLIIDDKTEVDRPFGAITKGEFRDRLIEWVGEEHMQRVMDKMASPMRQENGGGYVWNEHYQEIASNWKKYFDKKFKK